MLSESVEEIIKINKAMENQDIEIIVVYVSPKTRTWEVASHQIMLRNILDKLREILYDTKKMLVMGD